MIRVFLLDDHSLVRTGFRMILSYETDMEVVGEAASGEEGLPLIRQLKPDVVVCDLHLPGVSGLEVTERVRRWDQGSRVIIVSVQDEGPMPRRLLEVGASGYLGKGGEASELLKAIREVAQGRRYLAPQLAQRLALDAMVGGESPFDGLSPRELEVAMLLCQGKRLEDIAQRLKISAKTVATHKYRSFNKLGVEDVMALSRLALQYGAIERIDA
ncbi:MAG: response regulator [Xanthomonadaceae bacterium]|nr:response regulator [Xanthomonadaceae bacterium]MDP2185277.1 response regulator [Xanthomonadales bacterium]MDZ4116847.1 response regulator [Xanthomonadaceae bacterium]MDZ4378597.1 response regulator [Xanthomonadaceae bacterium]